MHTHIKREKWDGGKKGEERIKEDIESKNNVIRTKIMNDKLVSIQKK